MIHGKEVCFVRKGTKLGDVIKETDHAISDIASELKQISGLKVNCQNLLQ